MVDFIGDRLASVHIPKCAGTAVKQAFLMAGHRVRYMEHHSGVDNQHNPITSVTESTQAISFCLVREPLAWYRSLWTYGCSRLAAGNIRYDIHYWKPCMELLNLLDLTSFSKSLRCILDTLPGYLSWLYKVMTNRVDYIGTVERIDDSVATVCGMVKYATPKIIRVNASKHPLGLRTTVNAPLLSKMNNVEADAYTLWERAYNAH